MPAGMDQAFVARMKEKMEQEARKRELELLTYWHAQLETVLKKRHADLASLTSDLKTLLGRMETRLKSI